MRKRSKKGKKPGIKSVCRDCKTKVTVYKWQYHTANNLRCTNCGGPVEREYILKADEEQKKRLGIE